MSTRKSIGFLALVFSLCSLALPLSAAEKSRTVVTVEDGDYFGFDMRTEQNVSLDQCEASCIGDSACRAFTYNPKVKWCFLKSDFNQLNTFAGAIAGKIVEAESEPDIGAPTALSFVTEEMRQAAREAKADLSISDDQQALGANGLIDTGRSNLPMNVDSAIAAFKGALSITPDDGSVWIEVARALNTVKGNSDANSFASAAALNGYQLTRTVQARADSLVVLAKALENGENFRGALSAYKESLKLVSAKTVQAAYVALRARQGFRIIDHTIDADSATPRACVQFSEPLVKRGVDYTPFVLLDGAAPKAVEAKDNQICVEGLEHGQTYKLALRAGLPSSVDENLEAEVDLDLYVKDRSATLRFTGENFVLPSTARRGIPLVSVNTQAADLKLYRIGDRNIASLMTSSQFLTQLDGYSADRIADESGELVWQGAIDIASDLNRDVITSFPVDEALPARKPGVYVLTASLANKPADDWESKATQWFVVSDIGLTTYAGTDGLNVFARALGSAKPLAGVDLQLLAKNNDVLGTATTDADGHATFTAGLIRGGAAQAPAVITASNGDSDYVFLDMTRAGFDLSDRGVTGRPAPGAIDILAWTERGIYRPGETVHAAALARGTDAVAIEHLPLTFIFTRPDGVEYRRMVSDSATIGGYAVDLPVLADAMRGSWTMQIYTDPKKSAIGSKSFLVDDFVPDRIEFDLASEAKAIEVGTPVSVSVDGRYLYGAPAAGLALEGEVNLKPTRTSPDYERYQFGLDDEEAAEDSRIPLDALEPLDDDGQATFDVAVNEVPSTTQLLNAEIVVRMREGGGRAVERKLTLPVRAEGPMLGIKPEFSGALSEGALAKFHVIAIDPSGKKQAMAGVKWKMVNLERHYQWYRDGNSWRFEPVVTTKQVANGAVDVSADGADISAPVAWGRYRLEVETGVANGPASSVVFEAGWYVEASSTETPDALEIGFDKQAYAVGDVAKLKVSSRFAGELLLTIGTDNVIATQTASIAATGGEVDIPVTKDWGAGAYVTATLFRPGEAQESRMPMRAIGISWLSVDPGDRTLKIALTPPEKTLPRQPLVIPVSVTGAGVGDEAYVTVAAVDVGILNLTRYEAPDPDGWYFGQRRLGLEIRDIYGRLIDGSLGAMGRLRTGGDGGAQPLQGNPPKEKLVAFFSGPVKLDASGKAEISFDIPQFNGTARIMAVAWSKTGVGHATTDVIIRDPVVVTASLPKFLAPGDQSQMRLEIAATDAPSGDYQLLLTSDASVSIDAESASQTVALTTGKTVALTLPLSGVDPGDGEILVTLSDDSGMSLEQSLYVPVRPASLPVTQRRVLSLSAGQSLTIDSELLADSLLPGASVSVNVARSEGFDIPALLMSLDRYPYGCAEQTTSRALPLLYFNEMAAISGLPGADEIHKRVQDAIYKVLSYQASGGSFGLWEPGSGDMWLDAYVTDFLSRAREQKYDVPDQAMVQALENLQNRLGYDNNVKEKGNEIAYALYVLARNKKAAVSDLRYYADTMLADFPTPLAKAHLAAALALYGDAQRSKTIFLEAAQMTEQAQITKVSFSRSDYGSSLRDGAAVLALAAESRPVPPILPELTRIVAEEWRQKDYTSTQEQSWMLLAARALQKGDDGLSVGVNGAAHKGSYMARMTGDQLLENPLVVTNIINDPLTATVTTVAAPIEPLPAAEAGFTIESTYYTLDGEEANASQAAQNTRYVVVLKVTETNDWPQQLLITDLLPAGFEIDNPNLVDSATLANFGWIEQTTAAHTEFRNDRFVAAIDRPADDNSEITLAYVVRAVTPGTYDQPAASVEDMYRPQFFARTSTGRMEVLAAQ
ncbi:MAG: alpha-2-macroglobulin family protein [Allorhizobium sp.]